jgi:hypothetical protein
MGRLNGSEPGSSWFPYQRLAVLALLLVILGILAYKTYDEGWFLPHTPLTLNHEPALLFFNRHKGCDCAKAVYSAAALQVLDWPETQRLGVKLITIDLDRRAYLGESFQVIRAPSLLLVDESGQIIYRQDDVISDAIPLDLTTFESKIEALRHEK